MVTCFPVTSCAKTIVCLSECVGKQMRSYFYSTVSQSPSSSCCPYFHSSHSQQSYARVTISRTLSCSSINGSQSFQGCSNWCTFSTKRRNCQTLTVKSLVSSMRHLRTYLRVSLPCQNMSLKLSVPKRKMCTKIRWNVGSASWLQRGLMLVLLVSFSSSKPVYAEVTRGEMDKEDDRDSSMFRNSHGKKVYMDYSITGIPGDGRCMFRSLVHGACLRSGKPSPNESLQRELADDLRARVADEFIKRREDTEWFVEGDFDIYVSQIRKPHVWGGEPELFMASHVLQMPITVYMYDEDSRGLISIAEYGQEYGKDDPIRVLYHGFGHYDALQLPGKKDSK